MGEKGRWLRGFKTSPRAQCLDRNEKGRDLIEKAGDPDRKLEAIIGLNGRPTW